MLWKWMRNLCAAGESIKENDTVYYLGDFTLGNGEFADNYLGVLPGKKIFIAGSHDHRWIYGDAPTLFSIEFPQINSTYPMVFVLCHYAMRVWDRSHYGAYHLYGHSHGTLPGLGRSMDVGVDTNNFYPYHMDEIIERLSKIEPHNAPKH
jgi:calcineurin-like phosphoesterase family protein